MNFKLKLFKLSKMFNILAFLIVLTLSYSLNSWNEMISKLDKFLELK